MRYWWPSRLIKVPLLKMLFSRCIPSWFIYHNYWYGSLIFQQSSWGRFCVSLSAFKILLASHHIFVPFLDFVQAYGFKTHEDTHNWSGYRSKTSRAADPQGSDIHGKYISSISNTFRLTRSRRILLQLTICRFEWKEQRRPMVFTTVWSISTDLSKDMSL